MCDGAGLTPKLNVGKTNSGNIISSPFVTTRQLLRYRDDFTVIDIRDESERENKENQEYIKGIKYIAMGKLLASGMFIKLYYF